MFKKKLELLFIAIIFFALAILAFNFYNSYTFKHNPLPQSYQDKISEKEKEVLFYMQKNFSYSHKFPLVITDKIPGRLYGLTSYEGGKIKIYLNKKVMKESFDYIISDVIAHEYAHALLFKQNHFNQKNDGHSKLWQETCQKLGGKNCQQYVNQHEIILSKMPFQ